VNNIQLIVKGWKVFELKNSLVTLSLSIRISEA